MFRRRRSYGRRLDILAGTVRLDVLRLMRTVPGPYPKCTKDQNQRDGHKPLATQIHSTSHDGTLGSLDDASSIRKFGNGFTKGRDKSSAPEERAWAASRINEKLARERW